MHEEKAITYSRFRAKLVGRAIRRYRSREIEPSIYAATALLGQEYSTRQARNNNKIPVSQSESFPFIFRRFAIALSSPRRPMKRHLVTFADAILKKISLAVSL